MAKSYRPMFLVSGEWCGNAVRFPTRQEAENEARDRLMRWTLPTDCRADESDDEPNYRYVDHKLVAIGGAPQPAQKAS